MDLSEKIYKVELKAYLESVEGTVGGDIDCTRLVKLYGNWIGSKSYEQKYSPAECMGINRRKIEGYPQTRFL